MELNTRPHPGNSQAEDRWNAALESHCESVCSGVFRSHSSFSLEEDCSSPDLQPNPAQMCQSGDDPQLRPHAGCFQPDFPVWMIYLNSLISSEFKTLGFIWIYGSGAMWEEEDP